MKDTENFAGFLELFYNSFYFCCPFGKRTQLPKWHFVLILEKFQHFCEMWLSAKLDIFRLHFPFCPMFIFLQTFPNLAPIFISLTLMHHAEWFKTWAVLGLEIFFESIKIFKTSFWIRTLFVLLIGSYNLFRYVQCLISSKIGNKFCPTLTKSWLSSSPISNPSIIFHP